MCNAVGTLVGQVIQLEHSQRNNAAWKQVTCIVQCKHQGRTGGRPSSSGQIWSQGDEEEEEGEAHTSGRNMD